MITVPQPYCSALDEGLQNHRPVVICAARDRSDGREKGFANTVPCIISNTSARERQPRSPV